MKILLDTHAFLWAMDEEYKLGKQGVSLLEDPQNEVFSIASSWEIAIKFDLGKCPAQEKADTK